MRYQLIKSNPNLYKLLDALNIYRNAADVGMWTACKDAKPGDTLFIGQAGEKAGIYARATVASTPTLETPDDEFWVNPAGVRKPTWMSRLAAFENFRHHPLLEQNLIVIPVLRRVSKLLHIQGAVYHLRKEEGEAIDRLI